MKNRKNKLYTIILTAALFLSQSMTVFAVTESDVEAVGKETASGNVFIWFLCAIAFLKISQKIDSFLSSLGINVGHTGGSMMAELMVAARGAYHRKEHRRRLQFPGRFCQNGRKLKQRQPVLLPVRRACRCRGTPVYPKRHAHHDRAFQQPHQPQGI